MIYYTLISQNVVTYVYDVAKLIREGIPLVSAIKIGTGLWVKNPIDDSIMQDIIVSLDRNSQLLNVSTTIHSPRFAIGGFYSGTPSLLIHRRSAGKMFNQSQKEDISL